MYKSKPSSFLDIQCPYTAYCFDEACAYIIKEMEQGEEPQFTVKYKSFKDIYSKYK